jgi:hypothetical protein
MSSPVPTGAEHNSGEWRAAVAQSYRSTEVREIAKVLAALEPGATSSSKLMLAMRFEDTIFNASTSLADYRKRLAKRLKKLTKNYVATAAPSAASNQEQRLLELKCTYGERLKFIVDHAGRAIEMVKEKNELDKAKILQQHTANAKIWAADLGILEGSTPNAAMDPAAIDKLQQHLESRVDNIRAHVIKLSQPDLFLEETLDTLENEMQESTSQLLAAATSRRFRRVGWTEFVDPVAVLKENLDKAHETIPPPSRNPNSQKETALMHLERLRSISQAVLAFLAIPNKAETFIPRGVLTKSYSLAIQSLAFISDVTPQLVDRTEEKDKAVTLEDAWNKVLEFPTEDVSSSSSSLEQQPAKRMKVEPNGVPVMRSRVLLTPGRKTPYNLLQELKRKGAKLVRPPPNGEGTHLIVEFGDAFVMTIYLVPLLVTLRASTNVDGPDTNHASWASTRAGLDERAELHVWGVSGTPETLGHVVEQRLNYASANATHVLRKCFGTTSKASNDFEMEISEGTALLQFLQLARTTYMPNFEEDETALKTYDCISRV